MHKALFLLATFLLAGCATRSPAPQPSPVPQPPVGTTPAPVMSAADYLAISASRSLLLVRGAEMVAARVPALAEEAARIAAAHRGVAAQLNMAGRRLNLLLSAELLAEDRERLEALDRAPDVAAAWKRTLGLALSHCYQHEESYSRNGESPTLRPVARFAQGMCTEELARQR